MPPGAAEAHDRRVRVPAEELRDEEARLVDLVFDHAVAGAPVQLERHTGERELPHERVWAAARICERRGQRRAADLLPREPLQTTPALELRKVPVPPRHVGRRVERGHAGEQMRVARGEQQRFLSAHRAADCEDAIRLDVDPVAFGDPRHAREVRDLPGRPPRVVGEPSPLAGRIDDGEAAERREVAEEAGVLPGRQAATVRRDDERDRAAPITARQQQVRGPQPPVVRAVADHANQHRRLRRRGAGNRDGQQDEQGQRRAGEPRHARAPIVGAVRGACGLCPCACLCC